MQSVSLALVVHPKWLVFADVEWVVLFQQWADKPSVQQGNDHVAAVRTWIRRRGLGH